MSKITDLRDSAILLRKEGFINQAEKNEDFADCLTKVNIAYDEISTLKTEVTRLQGLVDEVYAVSGITLTEVGPMQNAHIPMMWLDRSWEQ